MPFQSVLQFGLASIPYHQKKQKHRERLFALARGESVFCFFFMRLK
jgi:hypothetical protein